MKKKLRVLHIVGAMNRAGTETMLMNIFRNMDRSKVHFDFISFSQQVAHYDEEIHNLGGRVIRMTNPQSILEIIKAIRKYGPYDAVHSHTLFHCGIANLAAKVAGVKIRIAHAHTTLDKNGTLLRWLYINSMRATTKLTSTHYLACSKQAGEYLFGNAVEKNQKYMYFPNLIDYSQFISRKEDEVALFKKEVGLADKKVIGHIGRFTEGKNQQFLLKVLKSIIKKDDSYRLLLVGDGDLKEKIQESAKKEGIHEFVKFVGIRDDIATMLHSMDVFVFPSMYEGLGLVLLEAQASGLPCIVSEAIQPEADMKLGLLSKLSIQDAPDVWAEKVIGTHQRGKKQLVVTGELNSTGYSFSNGIPKLIKIYQSNIGGTYEKDINYML
ncbi:glycosyltransferase family 1 protein [Sutcliffiella horikoshii]|uniref:Glycosyltransferase family 1 protein n=2 Tax=Sutcliffiella horikoshii TaxID=79883 RepID=A0AA95B880_9BACI|nr:glycosyltransferase family 1 protein [Sutcliffiella horikoshii]